MPDFFRAVVEDDMESMAGTCGARDRILYDLGRTLNDDMAGTVARKILRLPDPLQYKKNNK